MEEVAYEQYQLTSHMHLIIINTIMKIVSNQFWLPLLCVCFVRWTATDLHKPDPGWWLCFAVFIWNPTHVCHSSSCLCARRLGTRERRWWNGWKRGQKPEHGKTLLFVNLFQVVLFILDTSSASLIRQLELQHHSCEPPPTSQVTVYTSLSRLNLPPAPSCLEFDCH